jgi:hypothetical protein
MASILCKKCVIQVICRNKFVFQCLTACGISSMLLHDFVSEGNFAYKLSVIYSMREKPLYLLVRKMLYCAGSWKVPYIKHVRWHSWSLSFACRGLLPTFTVTVSTVYSLWLPLYPVCYLQQVHRDFLLILWILISPPHLKLDTAKWLYYVGCKNRWVQPAQ